jgi:hypothetical protein
VVRELPNREDVDEVEEELERRHDALSAGCPRDGDPHAAIVRPRDEILGDARSTERD